jgi:uncharacterized protein
MSADSETFKGKEAPPSNSGKSEVISVIHHDVRSGVEGQYEAWLKEITPIAQRFQGHRGVNVIRPPKGSRAYTIVLHFDTLKNLERWLSSETRKRLINQVEPFLEEGDQVEIKTGLEFWFTPPASEQKRAKPYKQFLLTLSVIFPLTIVVPWVLQPLFHTVTVLGLPGISNLFIAAVIVGLMTYLIMPHYTRLVAAWLYR